MVVDPNGQVTVSYQDAHGRVIATSLAGDSPQNLEALPSNAGATAQTIDLTTKNAFETTDGPAIVATHNLLVISFSFQAARA
jgi:hypothetical protein